ncbi:MAG: undecaprenyldiphospho-muramoylpentapeptide beta-N-acetylglucosaminyltransferase [Desulfurobacteriaceae bacterium]
MRVLLAGGGTGGHLFPCLAVAKKLESLGYQVLYVGSKNGIEAKKKELLPKNHVLLDVKGIRGKGLKTVFNIFSLFKSLISAYKITKEFSPSKVVIFGGYVSFPIGISATLLKIPLILQEQNSIPGKTNRFLAKFASKILVGYKSAEKFFGRKTIFTGNPVREEIVSAFKERDRLKKKVLEKLHLSSQKKTLLVIGGSQGALWLNEIMKETIPLLTKFKDRLQIVHITGEGKNADLEKIYRSFSIEAKVFPFHEKIWELYSIADGAISRSGALSISEIAIFGIPTLFIPFPYAVDDHQYFNAKDVEESQGCILRRQNELSPQKLVDIIERLLFDIIISNELSKNIKKFGIENAVDKIVEEIIKDG